MTSGFAEIRDLGGPLVCRFWVFYLVVCVQGGSIGPFSRVAGCSPGSVWGAVGPGEVLRVDITALGCALGVSPVLTWPGVLVALKPFDQLDFWLAGASADVCRIIVLSRAVEAGSGLSRHDRPGTTGTDLDPTWDDAPVDHRTAGR